MSCISLQLGSQLQNRYNTPILISTTGAAKGKKDKDRCATDTGEFALCIVEQLAPLLPSTNANAVMCFRLEYNFDTHILSHLKSYSCFISKKVELVTYAKKSQPETLRTERRMPNLRCLKQRCVVLMWHGDGEL